MSWQERAEKAEAEVERLRRINSGLVRDHNALLMDNARRSVDPQDAAAAIQLVQSALAEAERQCAIAIGYVERHAKVDE